jgi:hypothetical protein
VEFKNNWLLEKHLDIGYDTNRINIIKFKFHGNIKRYGF